MKTIKVSKLEMETLLPSNIKDSELLQEYSKKVLTVIINYIKLNEVARKNGFLAISNSKLRESAQISMEDMFRGITELQDFGLISRTKGSFRKEGEKPIASTYTVNWNKLSEPLKRPSAEDFIRSMMEKYNTPTVEEKNETIDTPTVESDDLSSFESPIVEEETTSVGDFTAEETSKMVTLEEAERHLRFKFQNLCGEGKNLQEIKTILDNTVQHTYANGTKALRFEAVMDLYELVNELVDGF